MFKKIIFLLLLSVAIIFFMPYAHDGVQVLITAHDWVAKMLSDVFTDGQAGNLAKGILALLAIPLLVGLVPAILYWFARKSWLPYWMDIVWVVWLIQAGVLIATYQVTA